MPNLLDDISTRAKIRGVTLSQVVPLPVEPGPAPFDTYKYNMSVIGHYDQIGQFLADVASLQRIIVPVDLSVSAGQQPTRPRRWATRPARCSRPSSRFARSSSPPARRERPVARNASLGFACSLPRSTRRRRSGKAGRGAAAEAQLAALRARTDSLPKARDQHSAAGGRSRAGGHSTRRRDSRIASPAAAAAARTRRSGRIEAPWPTRCRRRARSRSCARRSPTRAARAIPSPSLINTDDGGPEIGDLDLVGVYHGSRGRRPTASSCCGRRSPASGTRCALGISWAGCAVASRSGRRDAVFIIAGFRVRAPGNSLAAQAGGRDPMTGRIAGCVAAAGSSRAGTRPRSAAAEGPGSGEVTGREPGAGRRQGRAGRRGPGRRRRPRLPADRARPAGARCGRRHARTRPRRADLRRREPRRRHQRAATPSSAPTSCGSCSTSTGRRPTASSPHVGRHPGHLRPGAASFQAWSSSRQPARPPGGRRHDASPTTPRPPPASSRPRRPRWASAAPRWLGPRRGAPDHRHLGPRQHRRRGGGLRRLQRPHHHPRQGRQGRGHRRDQEPAVAAGLPGHSRHPGPLRPGNAGRDHPGRRADRARRARFARAARDQRRPGQLRPGRRRSPRRSRAS